MSKRFKIKENAPIKRVKQMKKDIEKLLEKDLIVGTWVDLMLLLIDAEKLMEAAEK